MVTFGTGIGSALFTRGVLVPNTEFGHVELRGHDAESPAPPSAPSNLHDLSWGKWAERVEEYLRHMEALLSPSLTIVGGGISLQSDRWVPRRPASAPPSCPRPCTTTPASSAPRCPPPAARPPAPPASAEPATGSARARMADEQQQAGEPAGQARAGPGRAGPEPPRRRWLTAAGAAVIVIAAAVGITLAVSGGGQTAACQPLAPLSTLGSLQPAPAPGPLGPEGVPVPAAAVLASTATVASGQAVDGISCQTDEQTLFHIHAHLTVFVNGSVRQVPAAIGIPGAQATATPQGPFIVPRALLLLAAYARRRRHIHIESPVTRTYTLGNFFDEWGQPLSPDRVGPARRPCPVASTTARLYQRPSGDIPLTAHAQIQLQVGTPLVAPQQITFPSGL